MRDAAAVLEVIRDRGRRGLPLGLPTWSNKLIQEVIRLLEEAYYEPG